MGDMHSIKKYRVLIRVLINLDECWSQEQFFWKRQTTFYTILLSVYVGGKETKERGEKKKKASAAADKRQSVFSSMISCNYIRWRGGKLSSPWEGVCGSIVLDSLRVIKLKLQGKEKIS